MKWEYNILKIETVGLRGGLKVDNSLEQEMNKLGEQGWEEPALLEILSCCCHRQVRR